VKQNISLTNDKNCYTNSNTENELDLLSKSTYQDKSNRRSTAVKAEHNNLTYNIDNLKLLSISKVAQILGVRNELVKSFIEEGKLRVLQINKRMKIPYSELQRFVNDNLQVVKVKGKRVGINISDPRIKYTSQSFDSIEIANKIIGDKNGKRN